MSKASTKRWRAKEYYLRYSGRNAISITVRRFKLPKANRSKANRQIVIPLRVLTIKEIVVQRKTRHCKTTPKIYTFVIRFKPSVLFANLAIVIGLIGTGIFGYIILNPPTIDLQPTQKAFALPVPRSTNDYTKPKALPRSQPIKLQVDKIGLDVKIKTVGKLRDGTMETPNVLDYSSGWYKYSPTPGELGPAVIVGHVDSYKGPSVFWRLRELVPGDVIKVLREDGGIANFKVLSLQQFEQSNFPTNDVYGNIDYPGLRLITCGGTFNKKTGHYTENTVVFAKLINN